MTIKKGTILFESIIGTKGFQYPDLSKYLETPHTLIVEELPYLNNEGFKAVLLSYELDSNHIINEVLWYRP